MATDTDTDAADYDTLKRAVSHLLPTDAAGVRRPTDRDALRVYWELGGLLNQHLATRATYGKRTMARLAADLQLLPRTLYRARRVHDRLPADLPASISWSHCRLLVTVEDDDARQRLVTRVAAAGWTVRRLQDHLQQVTATPIAPPAPRAGTYRIVADVDAAGDTVPAFDLGFGIRRPLVLPDKPGKRTRRLLRELAPGDAVELTQDDKGRPALHRVLGQVEQRLYVYPVRHVQVAAAATIRVQLDLGFDVSRVCRLQLQPPAHRLTRPALTVALAAESAPLLARIVQSRRATDYAVDLYRCPGGASPECLNTLWVQPPAPTT